MEKYINKLELALNDFYILFRNKSNREKDYQEWLEKHPIIFQILGIENFISRPLLNYSSQELEYRNSEEPDFLLKPVDNEWQIFEIKTPFCNTTKNHEGKRRNHFYSEFNSYVTQVKNYQEYFQDSGNLIQSSKKYGYKFSKNPRAIILAGLSESTDRELSRRLLPADISIMTFDELIKRLEYSYKYSIDNLEYPNGMSIILYLKILSPIENGCVFEIGSMTNKNNISLWINNSHKLFFRVYDNNCDEINIPVSNAKDYLNEWIFITIEIKSSNKTSVLRIDIDKENKTFSESELIDFEFPFNKMHLTLGSNSLRNSFSKFSFSSLMIFHKPLSIGQKQGMIAVTEENFRDKEPLGALFNKSIMHTSKHPLLSSTEHDGEQMDLVASKGYEPTLKHEGTIKKLVKLYSLMHLETVIVSPSYGVKFETNIK